MKTEFFKNIARITLMAYTSGVMMPASVFAAPRATPLEYFQEISDVYASAKVAYGKGGVKALEKKIPSRLFSKDDVHFIVEQTRGARELPNIEVTADGKMHITIGQGQGVNEKVTLEVIDAAKNEFAINGKVFTGTGSVENNFNMILKLLHPEHTSSSLWEFFVPNAQAAGMGTMTLVLGAIALVAAIAAVYFFMKNKKNETALKKAQAALPDVSEVAPVVSGAAHSAASLLPPVAVPAPLAH